MRLVGPSEWHLVPRPLSSLGNSVSPLDPGLAAHLSQEGPPPGGVAAVAAGDQSTRLIHPDEFVLASEVMESRSDTAAWEVLKRSPATGFTVQRRKGESLNGPITILLQGSLPGIPVELAAELLNNFTDRSTWDTQQVNFRCHDDWGCPETHCNGLFSFTLKLAPLADRDFVNAFAVARSADGNGYMTFVRDCEHPRYPVTKVAVRAQLHINVMYLHRDASDPNSSHFVIITKQDVKMGLIPFWVINMVIPDRLHTWKKQLTAQCKERLKAAQRRHGDKPLVFLLTPFFRDAGTAPGAGRSCGDGGPSDGAQPKNGHKHKVGGDGAGKLPLDSAAGAAPEARGAEEIEYSAVEDGGKDGDALPFLDTLHVDERPECWPEPPRRCSPFSSCFLATFCD